MNNKSNKHKNFVKNVFNSVADQYGTNGIELFSYFGQKLIEYAEIGSGKTVLDVACGKGASLFLAREKTGKSGKVIGIDLSPEMLKHVESEIAEHNFDNVEIYEMDAEELKFETNTFDVVLSGFSLFFFPNLKNALDEIYRVLKPECAFIASTFGERDDRWKPVFELFNEVQKSVKNIPVTKIKMLNSKEEIIDNFEQSSFKKIKIYNETKEFHFNNEQDWWNSMWSHGYRGILEKADKNILDKFKEDSFQILNEYKNKSGIPQQMNVLITKAYK